jgi:hypothetical protein
MVAVRLVILMCCVSYKQKEHLRSGTANKDAVNCVCVVFGALDDAVFFMVEVSQREKWNPGPLVMSNAMDEEEWGC